MLTLSAWIAARLKGPNAKWHLRQQNYQAADDLRRKLAASMARQEAQMNYGEISAPVRCYRTGDANDP
ncbi:hypothetical protein, partial [Bradyrhizobium sp. 2]|uniref:hypothetical protein n=1 Tax=Bradyrhizobium sp. 2 TaxID=190045 RepID=UPI001FF8CA8F